MGLTPFLTPHADGSQRFHILLSCDTQKRRLFAAAAFFYTLSFIIHVQIDHTYMEKNFGSSESRFAADA